MRVLSIGNRYPPHGVGGYERVWRSFVAHLRSRGDEVTVLCTDVRDGPPDARDEPAVHRDLRWAWEPGGWRSLGRAEARALLAHDLGALATRCNADRPDVVVWMNMGGLPSALLDDVRARRLPSVAVVHDGWLVYGPRVDPTAALRRPWQRGPKRPEETAWVFNSGFVRDRSLPSLPPGAATQVVHPGIDPAAFDPVPAPVGWSGRLLMSGRIAPEKGVDVALRALDRIPEATLTVVGPGAPPVGAPARAAFPGPAADDRALRDAYAASDVVLFPVTWEEPFGLVPLEAMAVGRPVVATGTGGSAEYLRDGENALLVTPGNAAALGAAIARLADDAALREHLVAGGRRTAERFTATAHDTALAAVLDRAAGL